MFELEARAHEDRPVGLSHQPQPDAAPRPHSTPYLGPERRRSAERAPRADTAADSARQQPTWLTRMLDEVDYGMLLVSADAKVLYLNLAAKLELDGAHPLQIQGMRLRTQSAQDAAPLSEALGKAQRGLRGLLTLGGHGQRVSISVVPMEFCPARGGPEGNTDTGEDSALAGATLLMLGKRQLCAKLSVLGYARSLQMTPAETRVLEHLCDGIKPEAIAVKLDVSITTVRSHIGAIRNKTGTRGIRELVHQIALLPPLLGALRSGPQAD